jgi:RNA polymerase sigma factor (sigma-70 family)
MSAPVIREYLKVLGAEASGQADADLVARFAASRDEAAFELLVWRHAGLVQRVCRAVLRDHHAAEDAAQATFLVLARRAGSITGRGSVVGWLYRVARRVSFRLAKQRARLPAGNAELNQVPVRPADEPEAADTAAALCAEIDRLPERYREPVLLCFFEGLTHAEAARRTGCPVGTVAGRLARAKELLARRLSRRGVGLAAVALPVAAGSFVGSTAQAAAAFAAGRPVAPLVSQTVLSLAQGASQAMTSSLLKLTAAAAALVCAVTGGVWGFAPSDPTEPTEPAEPQQPRKSAPPARPAPLSGAENAAAAGDQDDRIANAAQRRISANNLKQIMLAIHAFENTNGRLPNDITDKNGRPLLSWRVAILPWIEQGPLYKQFKLDEPWDSEHNKKLADVVVKIYTTPGTKGPKTNYKVFAGPGTAFEPGEKVKFLSVTDGTSNTIGVIEAGPAVVWTKPEDIPYDPKKAFPTLDGPYKNVVMVGLLDGSVRAFKPDLKAEEFRKWVERADGLVVDPAATAPELKEVSKEDRELVRKIMAENARLKEEILTLMQEREKLLLEAQRKQKVPAMNVDRLLDEHEAMKREVEKLKEQIERIKTALERDR